MRIGFGIFPLAVIGWILFEIFLGPVVRSRTIGYVDGTVINRLPWVILLLPAAILVRRPERADDRKQWHARLLLPVLVLDLLILGMNTILFRAPFGASGNTLLLLGYGIEPFFLAIQVWIILYSVQDLAVRIPAQPMFLEAHWLRWIFVPLLVVAAATTLILAVARIWRPIPGVGEHWLGPLWGPVIGQIAFLAQVGGIPLWLFFPIHLIRFFRHLHGARQV